MSIYLTLRTANQADATRTVLDLLTEIHRTAKREISAEDLALDTRMLIAEVNQYFSYVTIEELCTVLRAGVRGYYDKEGKVYALSISTYHQWILSYLNTEERIRFVRKMQEEENRNRPQLEQHTKKSTEEIRQGYIELSEETYAAYDRCGQCVDVFNLVYNFLDSEGMLSFSNEDKNAALKEVTDDMSRTSPKEVKRLGDLAQGRGKAALVSRAKTYLLKKYFDALIEKNEALTFKK